MLAMHHAKLERHPWCAYIRLLYILLTMYGLLSCVLCAVMNQLVSLVQFDSLMNNDHEGKSMTEDNGIIKVVM